VLFVWAVALVYRQRRRALEERRTARVVSHRIAEGFLTIEHCGGGGGDG
jgi:hypothetical protein